MVSVERVPVIDVRSVRQKLGLSQARFAARFGFTPATIRNWEQGRTQPDGSARVLLAVIAHHPDAVEDALRKASYSKSRQVSASKMTFSATNLNMCRLRRVSHKEIKYFFPAISTAYKPPCPSRDFSNGSVEVEEVLHPKLLLRFLMLASMRRITVVLEFRSLLRACGVLALVMASTE